jgi:hypothetical protein
MAATLARNYRDS